MSATWSSEKPSMDDSRPTAAMIAPPGTPGAAIMVTPSMRMKPTARPGETSRPDMNTMAKAYRPIFIIEPARWMVAHSGMTKPATLTSTRFFSVEA